MSRGEAIQGDAANLAACALELAIVDHDELEHEAQRSHAITACLLAAVTMAAEDDVDSEHVTEHLLDLLQVALAMRNKGMN